MAIFVTKKDKNLALKVNKILSKEYDVGVNDLFGISREHHITKVRFMAWYILKNNYSMGFSTIARLFNKDHSTIMHGIRQVELLELQKEMYKSCYPHIHSPYI